MQNVQGVESKVFLLPCWRRAHCCSPHFL